MSDDTLCRIFRSFPGMEYCDLKQDRASGRSKGYAYVGYSTHEAAAAAVAQLNGADFPPNSGYCLKVLRGVVVVVLRMGWWYCRAGWWCRL